MIKFDLENDKVMIAMPILHGVNPMTMLSLMGLTDLKPQFHSAIMLDVPIDMARNILIERFLRYDTKYLLFVDSDMSFEPDALKRLVERKKNIIGGLCFQRYPPYLPTLIKRIPTEYDPSLLKNHYMDMPIKETETLVDVDATGAGFLLIHRDVFMMLKRPYFMSIYNDEMTELLCGEDMYFCDEAKKMGYDIYVDTDVVIQHTLGPNTTVPDIFSKGFLQHGSKSIDLAKKMNNIKK